MDLLLLLAITVFTIMTLAFIGDILTGSSMRLPKVGYVYAIKAEYDGFLKEDNTFSDADTGLAIMTFKTEEDAENYKTLLNRPCRVVELKKQILEKYRKDTTWSKNGSN